MKPWRLEDHGPTIFRDGRLWFRCTRNHYSDGVKYNGMYCDHKTEDHDTWRAEFEKSKAAKRESEQPATSGSDKPVEKAESAKSESAGNSESASGKPDKKWKLAMNQGLMSAVVTNANLTPQQYQAFWTKIEADADEAVANGN